MESASNYYLVMPLCNNGDLSKFMEKKGVNHLAEPDAVFVLQQVALGFEALHKQNVMHRDFKMDNLFLNDDNVLIAD